MGEIFKIMLIGDISTGKTSFLTKLIYQNAQKMPRSTSQLSFFTFSISSPSTILQLWDTPGDNRYSFKAISILQQFRAVLIFIDSTNEHTLNKARLIIDQLKLYPWISRYFILTKIDIVQKMKYKRKVSNQQVQYLAKLNNGLMFQYSQQQQVQSILEQIVIHYYSITNINNNISNKINKPIFNHNNTNNHNQNIQNNNQIKKYIQASNQTQNQSCDCQLM